MYCSMSSELVPILNIYINCPTLVNVNSNPLSDSPFKLARCRNSDVSLILNYDYGDVVSVSNIFAYCYKYQGDIQKIFNRFPNVVSTRGVFTYCNSYNKPVNIPDTVSDCWSMFSGCNNFNSVVRMGNNVENASRMFYNCRNFDSIVIASNNLGNCCNMFNGCINFSPTMLVLPNTIYNSMSMFNRCLYLDSGHTSSIVFNGFASDAYIRYTFQQSKTNLNIIVRDDITSDMNAACFISNQLNNVNILLEGNVSFKTSGTGHNTLIDSSTSCYIYNTTVNCRGQIHNYLFTIPPTGEIDNLHIETSSLSSAIMSVEELNTSYGAGNIRERGTDLTNNNGYNYTSSWYYSDYGFEYVGYYSYPTVDRRPIVFVNYM